MTTNLSYPVLAHASSPVHGSNTHWLHSTILALTCECVTESKDHSFTQQDKQIYRTLYADLLKTINQIQADFTLDPTRALTTLRELQFQLNQLLQ
jgi:hypothetical protein